MTSSIEATGKDGGSIMKKRVVIEYDPEELESAASDFGTGEFGRAMCLTLIPPTVPTARASLSATYGVVVHGVVAGEEGSSGGDASGASHAAGKMSLMGFVAFNVTVVLFILPMIQALSMCVRSAAEGHWVGVITAGAVLIGLWCLSTRVFDVLWRHRSQLAG